MNNKTEMGLLLIVFGIILSIFATLGTAAAGGLQESNLSPGACLPAILSLVGLLLLFIGWIFMIIGRKEFGEKHAQFVVYSLIALIVGVAIVIIGTIISILAAFTGEYNQDQSEVVSDYVMLANGMSTAVIFSSIGGVIVTVGAILLVYCLENDLGKKILFLALVVSIIVSIIATLYLVPAYRELGDKLEEMPEEDREAEFNEVTSETSAINALDVIGTVLLVIAYIIPYNRIKKGELKPVIMAPQPYGMSPYPPGYPYQPYPPQQAPYPYQPYPPQQAPYPYQPYPPPDQQHQGYPEESEKKSDEDAAQPEPSQPGTVQPMAVSPEALETKRCMFCDTQIPKGSTTCPVCRKELS